MTTDPRFVSEEISPLAERLDTASMARGEPALPAGFRWRDEETRVREVLSRGRGTGVDRGETYVRRHTFRLRMDEGAIWNVYVTRQPPIRWYLKTIERADDDPSGK